MNVVALMGRLTATPELRQTPNGTSVCSFSIAVDRYSNGEKKADFINCVAWRETAENIARYFEKGKMIGLNGSIQTRQYQDRDTGKNRTAFEVLVDRFHFAQNSNTQNNNQTTNNYYSRPQPIQQFQRPQYAPPQQGYSVPQYQQPAPQQWGNPKANLDINPPAPQQQSFVPQPQPRFAPAPQPQQDFSTAALDGFQQLASDEGDLPFSGGAGI